MREFSLHAAYRSFQYAIQRPFIEEYSAAFKCVSPECLDAVIQLSKKKYVSSLCEMANVGKVELCPPSTPIA
jgi:hypothetical protein